MKTAEHYRGREQTYLKHFFLEHYLDRVAFKVGSFVKEFVYVDGFSGPWRTEDPGFGDSSFVIAINKLRQVREGLRGIGKTPRIRCVFVEPDPAVYPLLEKATSDVTDIQIHPLNSEFEEAIPEILSIVGSAFLLVFIDPTGWTGFGLHQIAPILRDPGEVLINFMFDHINRFLTTPDPEMSFDDLFGGSGWKAAVQASPRREDAVIDFYTQQLKTIGKFAFGTSTRIKKPLSDRSYFHLVYATRHREGLLEFRNVEKKEIAEQERIRLGAKQLDRIDRTGQDELFKAVDLDPGLASFEEERGENLSRAERLLTRVLRPQGIDFADAQAALLEIPLVWEQDVQRIVKAYADIVGLKPRERTAKPGHWLKRKNGPKH